MFGGHKQGKREKTRETEGQREKEERREGVRDRKLPLQKNCGEKERNGAEVSLPQWGLGGE